MVSTNRHKQMATHRLPYMNGNGSAGNKPVFRFDRHFLLQADQMLNESMVGGHPFQGPISRGAG